jgi:Ca2+-binding EF-hand superfamily protein
MTYPLTDVQWDQISEAFRIFDTDADGLVTARDLKLLLTTYGFEHSEAELRGYLEDLPIILEGDAALDRAQFALWVMKLHERLREEDRQEQIAAEQEIQDLLDVGVLPASQAALERQRHSQLKDDREQLERTIEGEVGALDTTLFRQIDSEAKGFISVDDLRALAKESGEAYNELELDAMLHAVCAPGSQRRIPLEGFRKIMQATLCWDQPELYPCHKRILVQKAAEQKAEQKKNRRKPPQQSYFWRNLAIVSIVLIVLLALGGTIVFFATAPNA